MENAAREKPEIKHLVEKMKERELAPSARSKVDSNGKEIVEFEEEEEEDDDED